MRDIQSRDDWVEDHGDVASRIGYLRDKVPGDRIAQLIGHGDTVVVIDDGSDNKVTETVSEQGSTSVVGEIEISSEVISSSSE